MNRQEELAAMKDSGINFLVFKSLKNFKYCELDGLIVSFITGETIDFCNNPSDIMPIAFENSISIGPDTGEYGTGEYNSHVAACYVPRGFLAIHNKNPLRAICEVFILMNEQRESE